jgi:hypothetical protein
MCVMYSHELVFPLRSAILLFSRAMSEYLDLISLP